MNKLRSPDENENNASSWLGFKKKGKRRARREKTYNLLSNQSV